MPAPARPAGARRGGGRLLFPFTPRRGEGGRRGASARPRPCGRAGGAGAGGAVCLLGSWGEVRGGPALGMRFCWEVAGGGGGGGGYLPAVLGVPASPGFRLCCRLEPAGGAERIALLAFTAPKLIYFLPPEILDGLLECSRLSLY